ncbi:MAG: PIG-L family deacetylase [Gemmatimonadota bacterium]
MSAGTAQLPDEDYRGVAATGIALRKLETTRRVLVIAAHPDDEDTQLLSKLSLADGADVAYLSLTRGEGGQNSIGGELGPALGVLRTGELLAARRLDYGEQYFTRAYDFGFSKSAGEAFQHWPRDSILSDVVAAVRRFRPDIIVAIFSGTARDGHGQHQVSGILAREAFRAAADAVRFPERGPPHRALKLFQATSYRQAEPTHRIATGILDPLLGRSYSQVAAASRSRHRSQDMGQAQAPGPHSTSVRLIESRVPVADSTLFSGIDTTLSARWPSLQRYDSLIAAAKSRLLAYNTNGVARILAEAIRELTRVSQTTRAADLQFAIAQELEVATPALLQAAGVVVDVVSSVENVVPGESFDLDITVWNTGGSRLDFDFAPALPEGWRVARTDSAASTAAPGELVTHSYDIAVPADAAITQPYFLTHARPGDFYAWPSASPAAGTPFGTPPVQAQGTVSVLGTAVVVTRMATRRVVDPRQGELRRAVHVTPAFALRAAPATAVITAGTLASGAQRSIDAAVEVTSNGTGGTVVVRPVLPAGWRATPEQVSLSFNAAGESGSAGFAIAPPRSAAPAPYHVVFVATDSMGRTYDLDQRVVDYPHILNRVLYEPASMRVTVLDAKFARGTRAGYIVGVDEPIADVLEQSGVMLERLDESALANAELGIYDAVVVGSRAYEVRPDLVAHNQRLLEYARNGGHLIVLYQQYEFIEGGFAPYALTLARPHDRVTDESAPVRLLDSTAVALTRPNRISQRDFENWVQERSLYMPRTWAPQYTPLLEMNDPGQEPQRGALLTAPLGRGHYTYTGLAFLRQIPAGVPGALRLFINLLSMGIRDAF